jgi:hypothetical protein
MLVMNDCFVACLAVNHADDALYSLAEKMVGDRVSHFTFAQLYHIKGHAMPKCALMRRTSFLTGPSPMVPCHEK